MVSKYSGDKPFSINIESSKDPEKTVESQKTYLSTVRNLFKKNAYTSNPIYPESLKETSIQLGKSSSSEENILNEIVPEISKPKPIRSSELRIPDFEKLKKSPQSLKFQDQDRTEKQNQQKNISLDDRDSQDTPISITTTENSSNSSERSTPSNQDSSIKNETPFERAKREHIKLKEKKKTARIIEKKRAENLKKIVPHNREIHQPKKVLDVKPLVVNENAPPSTFKQIQKTTEVLVFRVLKTIHNITTNNS